VTSNPQALRVVAGLEALKGLLAGAVVIALLRLPADRLDQGLTSVASLLGLHPAGLGPGSLATLTLLAACYASVRLLEAWGLWRARRWGVWLGATSGAIYLPFELGHVLRGPGWLNVSVTAFNILLVAYLSWRLWRQEQAVRPVLLPAA
jgi:uncharacterized membrane protein (DUF2068 family)